MEASRTGRDFTAASVTDLVTKIEDEVVVSHLILKQYIGKNSYLQHFKGNFTWPLERKHIPSNQKS